MTLMKSIGYFYQPRIKQTFYYRAHKQRNIRVAVKYWQKKWIFFVYYRFFLNNYWWFQHALLFMRYRVIDAATNTFN